MKRALGLTWAIVSLLLGLGFLAWIVYNAYFAEVPASRGRPRIYHWVIGFAMVGVGIDRIRKWGPRKRDEGNELDESD